MAPHDRRADPPVEELLFDAEESCRFVFYQAVKLLEMLSPEAKPVGEGAEPDAEAVRFRSRVGLDFPASEIDLLSRPKDGQPVALVVNFLGLAGVLGPLPLPFTERVIEQTWNKDYALRDFLDLFNHRLISILTRARRRYRPARSWRSPETGLFARAGWRSPETVPFARAGFALLGLGTGGLADRMAVPDRALLPYAGLLVQQPRSQIGLEILLAHYFEAPVAVRPFTGRWLNLDPEEQTVLGRNGRNQVLGGIHGSAVLGARVWDQESGFELRLGPLHLHQFLAFLPIGRAFSALVDLVRFYAGNELDFTVRLELRVGQVPPCRLGWAARLGWTSWLKAEHFEQYDSQVVVRGKR